MKIIHTATDDPESLPKWERSQVYNGLDCIITAEVYDAIVGQLDNHTTATYQFEKELQGPVLEMRLRGVLVDQIRRAEVVNEYHDRLDRFEDALVAIVRGVTGQINFNWRSSAQLAELFYDNLAIPTIRRKGHITVDRAALERLEAYPVAWAIIQHLYAMRDLAKKISFLETEIDPDDRIRTSYNIGGTTTGRLSSSYSEFGTGTNLQNIEDALRSIFIADPGMKMGYADAGQGESRTVGAIEWNLFHDDRYLNACETGDLHTIVSKLCEPKWPWTEDMNKDHEIAERPYYRHHSLRKLCKSIGHGSNYGGKPQTLSRLYKIEIEAIEAFQIKYFRAFPAHERWHEWVAGTLQEQGYLVSLTGRKRHFGGIRTDPATIREAIAYDPQGSLADILNRGMLNVWRANSVQLLMQIHDAILFQFPENQEDELIPKILHQLRYPIRLDHGREFVIPYDCKTGWNFGSFSGDNIDGLKTFKGHDSRTRSPQVDLMDRPVR